jgi:hypothetical protein
LNDVHPSHQGPEEFSEVCSISTSRIKFPEISGRADFDHLVKKILAKQHKRNMKQQKKNKQERDKGK